MAHGIRARAVEQSTTARPDVNLTRALVGGSLAEGRDVRGEAPRNREHDDLSFHLVSGVGSDCRVARTSTVEQIAGRGSRAQFKAAGAERLFSEQVSSVGTRPELKAALDFVCEDDVFTRRRWTGYKGRGRPPELRSRKARTLKGPGASARLTTALAATLRPSKYAPGKSMRDTAVGSVQSASTAFTSVRYSAA